MTDVKEPDPNEPVKRLNYFTGQFLAKEDFLAEQQYHMGLRRRGNRVLYFGAGVLEDSGYRVSKPSANQIAISPGIAIDPEGRELVLVADQTVDVPQAGGTDRVVTIEYATQPTAEQTAGDTDHSDFTRVLEMPLIKVLPKGSQLASTIVIAYLTVNVNGEVTAVNTTDRQRAKARFAGDLTIGQGSNGALTTRHINGKGHLTDDADDLYLNWDNGKGVRVGGGGGKVASLTVSGPLEVQAPDNSIYSVQLSRTDEDGRLHKWALWHMNQQYRKNALEIWEYKADSTGKVCDGNPVDGAMCSPRLVIAEGGNVGIGTTTPQSPLEIMQTVAGLSTGIQFGGQHTPGVTAGGVINSCDANGTVRPLTLQNNAGYVGIGTTAPRAKLEIVGGAIMPAAGDSDQTGILFPLDPGGGAEDKAWIRYYSRYPSDTDPSKKEQMTLEIGVANDNNDHIALTPSGGVGIGTTTPTAKLEVVGSGDGSIDFIVNGRMQSNNNDGGLWISGDRFVGGHHTDKVGFWNGNDWRLTVQANGNVGIGSTTPDKYRLMVSGGDTRIAALGKEQSLYGLDKLVGLNDLRFYVDDTGVDEKMHLNSNGLTVNGDFSWLGDNVNNSYITLGRLRICWGIISGNVNNHQNVLPVLFPAQFSGIPAVMVTVDDPGFGTYDLKGGVGAYQVSTSDFKILYKSSERKDPRIQTFYWVAIGQSA